MYLWKVDRFNHKVKYMFLKFNVRKPFIQENIPMKIKERGIKWLAFEILFDIFLSSQNSVDLVSVSVTVLVNSLALEIFEWPHWK